VAETADDHSLHRAPRALAWSFANALASRLGTFAIGIAMARMLGPREFGTFAVAYLALMAALSFNELGVSLAIVRWDRDPSELAATVTTIAVVMSVVVAGGIWVVAPAFSQAMGDPGATDVVRVLGLTVIVSGVVATPAALLQRTFRQRERLIADQVNVWAGALTSLAAVLAEQGAMSLAIGRVVGSLAGAVLLLRYSPLPWRLGLRRPLLRPLLAFGVPLAGSSIVVFALGYVDQLVAGRDLGTLELGYYALAVNLAAWPLTIFSVPLRSVAPAVFARLRGDRPATFASLARLVGVLASATMPVCFLLAGGSAAIVRFVYGVAWQPAALVLISLGALAGCRILIELLYDFVVVVGSAQSILRIQVVTLLITVPAVVVGSRIGRGPGIAAAQLGVAVVVVFPLYLTHLRGLGMTISSLLRPLVLPAIASIAASGLGYVASERWDSAGYGAIAAGLIALVCAALLLVRQREALRELQSVLRQDRRDPGLEPGPASERDSE